ncbi:MAG: protein-L-isoaspartate O-methyltransferase family protein [Vicinamibacterales bacterium]
MSTLELFLRRRFYAEELDAVCAFRSPGLLESFAAVPRERFLPPGPWTVLSLNDFVPGAPAQPRVTSDDDPARVYHNIGIAIDPARQLFNGHPATLAAWIDALDLKPGGRVLHVGCGLGYYSAVMAQTVGPAGRVVAIEVDDALAAAARENLAAMSWVQVLHGDATALPATDVFDAILVNAGVTHPRDEWLDALAPRGRLMLPLTASMPAMGATIGKGFMMLITRDTADAFAVRTVGFVAIYSAIGLRDAAANTALGQAMAKAPFPPATRLRRDVHEPGPTCWFHTARACFSISD